MNYRQFGNTDLTVSEICFGPMRFSAKEPGKDKQSQEGQRALEYAIERGVNFIHSSYEYGVRWAMSETLKDHPKRHDLHHIIKVTVPDFGDSGKFDASKFQTQVEEALRDLHTDRIAVIQHLQRNQPNSDEKRIPNISAVHEQMMPVFEKLRDQGKVGYLTTFPYTPGFAKEALATGDFSGMVAYYNPIEIEMAQFFPEMEANGQGFFCIRPFLAGLLTDRRVDRSSLPADDRMQEKRWDAAYARLELVKQEMGKQVGGSWTDFAIKFGLAHPIVTSLIVGLNTVEQVDQVLDAADGNYPDRALVDEALALYKKYGLVLS
ncbi:MAG: aldo/keto reductase [Caldilineaceae bacterium]|nr:aldo/keto reductase [Caldilineaceae bacterium]